LWLGALAFGSRAGMPCASHAFLPDHAQTLADLGDDVLNDGATAFVEG
jgi:hypothetical protein